MKGRNRRPLKRLKKHLRELLTAIRAEGIKVGTVECSASGHYDVQILDALGNPHRVKVASTPQGGSWFHHAMIDARRAAGVKGAA